jgi:hypothetical protein
MGEQIRSQFGNGVGAITAYLPHLVSAIVIVAIGVGLSLLVRAVARRLLGKTGFDRLVGRHVGAVERRVHPSDAVASTLFWIGILVTAALTADALQLHTLAAGLKRILGYLPNALVAAVILAVGVAVARMIGGLVEDVASSTAAKVARGAIIVLAAFMALDQLGVAHNIVMTTFAVLLGAAGVALAIAFGVGNRQLAGDLTRRWVRRAEDHVGAGAADERPEERHPELPH